MATRTITFNFKVGTVLTDVSSVVLRSPDGSFGVKRVDTGAVVVAAGTALAHVSTGVYSYTFTEPTPGLTYTYWLEWVHAATTDRLEQTLSPIGTPLPPSGIVPIAPADFVQMGLDTVGCGDDALTAFLRPHADLVWAMQLRRGVVLDLHYQYFVLDLTGLAMDHVRMLIDLSTGGAQMGALGYSNASNVSDASATSERTATSSSTMSASATQSSTRSVTRTSSSTMTTSGGSTSAQSMTGSDTGSTVSHMTRSRVASNNSSTFTIPFLDSLHHDYKASETTSDSGLHVDNNFNRFSKTLLLLGQYSGQAGSKTSDDFFSKSSSNIDSEDHGSGTTTRRNTVDGSGLLLDNSTMTQTGTRTNNAQRTTSSSMSGSSTMSAGGSMASSAHSESHRSSSSVAHSESAGHASSSSTATSHAESAGASQMTASANSDLEYFNQIFESLQMLWDDTKKQIERLEQQVQIAQRYLISKLPVVSPQVRSIARGAAVADRFFIQRPGRHSGAPFGW